MTTVYATARPTREPKSDRYVCQRCGIENAKNHVMRTILCRDCRDVESLSREMAVVELLESGHRQADIAERLHLSPGTVSWLIKRNRRVAA